MIITIISFACAIRELTLDWTISLFWHTVQWIDWLFCVVPAPWDILYTCNIGKIWFWLRGVTIWKRTLKHVLGRETHFYLDIFDIFQEVTNRLELTPLFSSSVNLPRSILQALSSWLSSERVFQFQLYQSGNAGTQSHSNVCCSGPKDFWLLLILLIRDQQCAADSSPHSYSEAAPKNIQSSMKNNNKFLQNI